ncbi:SusC/RagA family TonB-linked outer membrane protein [Parapedobacter deserti]|uniref:SusC/RagA family TonB-linked outer membrane protein n=1 Tax=Parapedobacter deserti TaxID=1912957 RepID=A0ABV7JGW2_9SPHI
MYSKKRVIRLMLGLMLLLACSMAMAQQSAVTGTVRDAAGIPLAGVSVKIKGVSGTATSTDANGQFNVRVAAFPVVLEFAYIGHLDQEQTVNEEGNISVVLEEGDQLLDEVIVVAYGTQKRSSVVGSVAQIKGEEIRKAPAMNITNTLAGRLPGLTTLQQSGRPGADDATLYIRGVGTYGSNRTPLVIIDGVQRPSFNHLDASEIESITILKDAVATAAYGLQAAGGIILIKTKSGSHSAPRITYDGSLNIGQNTRFPKFLDGPDYMEWYNRAIEVDNDYFINHDMNPIPALYSPDLIEAVRNGTNTNPLFGNTDWMGMLLDNNSYSQHHGVTINGGNEHVRYFTSLAHLDQDGVIANTGFKRYNVRATVDATVNQYLTVGINLGLRQQLTNTPGISPDNSAYMNPFAQAARMLPNLPMYAPNGLPVSYNSNAGFVNPIASVEQSGYQRHKSNIFQGTMNVNFKVPGVEGLEAKVIASYDNTGQENKGWLTPYETMGRGREQVTGDFVHLYTVPGITKNSVRQSYNTNFRKTFQPSISYNKTLGDHSLSLLALYEWSRAGSNLFSAGASNLPITVIQDIDYGSRADEDRIAPTGSTGVMDARAGYVGRVNYSYKGRYLLEAVTRWDASVNFAPENRWKAFPGAGAAWLLSEEDFFKEGVSFVDNLKLKASWGRAGSDRQGYGNFGYVPTFSQNTNPVVVIDGQPVAAIYTNAPPNRDIRWETTTTTNVGFESSFLNGRFGLDFEWFYQHTTDILAGVASLYPPSIGGYFPSTVNVGELDNRGFDAQLRYNQAFGQFRLGVTGNVNWSRNRYLRLDEADNIPSWQSLIGKPVGTKIGFVVDGMVQTWEEARNTPSPSSGIMAPGFFRYRDLNGDGKLTRAEDMTYIGRSNIPELMYGLNIDLAYKGFDFSALLQGAGLASVNLAGTYEGSGGTSGVDDNTAFTRAFYGYGNSPYYLVENSWRPDNPNAEFPRLTAYRANLSANNAHINSGWERRGDYLRVRSMQLGYSFPHRWIAPARLQQLRLTVTGSNLFTFDYLKYLDPEMPNVNNGFYPQQRIFAFGVNVTF